MMKDPTIRRFISSSLFAGTFVWVAIEFFDVDPDVVWMLLGFCFVFVGLLIVVGVIGAPLVRLIRPKPPLLQKIAQAEREIAREGDAASKSEEATLALPDTDAVLPVANGSSANDIKTSDQHSEKAK